MCGGALASATRSRALCLRSIRWCVALNFREDGVQTLGGFSVVDFALGCHQLWYMSYIRKLGLMEYKGKPKMNATHKPGQRGRERIALLGFVEWVHEGWH
jgi:hypothetical protein